MGDVELGVDEVNIVWSDFADISDACDGEMGMDPVVIVDETVDGVVFDSVVDILLETVSLVPVRFLVTVV